MRDTSLFQMSFHLLHVCSSAFSKLFVKQIWKCGKANMEKTKLRAVLVWTHPSHLRGGVPDILPQQGCQHMGMVLSCGSRELGHRTASWSPPRAPFEFGTLRGISQLLSLGTEGLCDPLGGKRVWTPAQRVLQQPPELLC